MILKDLGLTRDPFTITPDPDFFYPSPRHRESLAQLEYGVQARRGFALLTGEVGTGKTTLIHALLKELGESTHTAFVYHTVVSARDLLRYVCEDLGVVLENPDSRELVDYLIALNRFLLECYRRRENVVLIIDEAQNLSLEVLESIRLLSNFETSSEKLLQILLVGQPELKEKLNAPGLRQLKQRIGLRCSIQHLNVEETLGYIKARLRTAGSADRALFTKRALKQVAEYSGIPRIINIVCDHCLLIAYAQSKRKIGVDAVEEAIGYLEQDEPKASLRNIRRPSHRGFPSRWIRGAVAAGLLVLLSAAAFQPEITQKVSSLLPSATEEITRVATGIREKFERWTK